MICFTLAKSGKTVSEGTVQPYCSSSSRSSKGISCAGMNSTLPNGGRVVYCHLYPFGFVEKTQAVVESSWHRRPVLLSHHPLACQTLRLGGGAPDVPRPTQGL